MPIDIRANFSRRDTLGRPFGIEGVKKALDRFGIETAILIPRLAVDADFPHGNKELLDAIKGDDRLYGYLVVNPVFPEESIRLMRQTMVLPKFVAMAMFQGSSKPFPNLDDCREVLNAYRRFTKPVMLDVTSCDAISAAEQIAAEFATIKFILGSMGSEAWKGVMGLSQLLNVFLETSGTLDSEKIEEAVESFGPRRVLFGSDLPFANPASMLALIQDSNVPKDVMTRILDTNARNLFGLGKEAASSEE
ncbi:MAG TPA: amidohydrolase family protein [Armatimonadota bacterium]|nr:amidohydrolase family protein [Armatimonadota bacterium]